MDEYINEGADIFNEEPPKKQHIVVRILKGMAAAVIILICGGLLFSCVQSCDHAIVEKVLMNEAFYEAYDENPEELTVEKYGINSAWIAISNGRMFELNNLYYIPKLNQLQFSIKYNEDLKYSENDKMPLQLKLVDEDGNEYTEYWFETAKRSKYEYVRVCFENIELIKEGKDENGQPLRRKLTLVVDMKDKNGKSREDDKYSFPYSKTVYDGRNVYKNIEYKVEK